MARTYTLSGDNFTVAGASILAFLNPPAAGATAAGFEVLRVEVSQRANATSAQVGIQLGTKVTAFPTLVSATPTPTSMSDPASQLVGNTTGAAGTAGINASANGAGAETVKYSSNFNALNGWLWTPSPYETFTMMPGATSGFFVKFSTAPSTLTGWSITVVYREL